MKQAFAVLCFGLILTDVRLSATTVEPPTFQQLVAEAQYILRGKVTAVRSAWANTPEGAVIKTYVTLQVDKQLKGEPGAAVTLELLGGEVGSEGMRVDGMPRFQVGQSEFLFVADNRVRFCPLVAMMHGRYRVLFDAATSREYMARDDGVPLYSETEVELPQGTRVGPSRARSPAGALTPAAFEQKITAELLRHAPQP